MKYAGTVTLLTVVSDKGYVYSTKVLRGMDKQLNKRAEETVRQWHLSPAMKS